MSRADLLTSYQGYSLYRLRIPKIQDGGTLRPQTWYRVRSETSHPHSSKKPPPRPSLMIDGGEYGGAWAAMRRRSLGARGLEIVALGGG